MERLNALLRKENPSYLTPLFWVHGEDEALLREMVGHMNDNGVGEFVIESRPHPDFLGERWWQDLSILLDEAKKRDMKVWFFDDCAYPSGYSAGKIRDNHPEYLKVYLAERHLDVIGPQEDVQFWQKAWVESDKGEELVAVVAAKRANTLDKLDFDSLIDITDHVQDGMLYWNVPEGNWRIFFFVQTREDGERGTKDYLNPIEPEPVRAFIDYVYEEHYKHFADEFGKTIAGFFSDEPRFGNMASYEAKLGCTDNFNANWRPVVVLPWSRTLLRQLSEQWQGDFTKVLPCLWYDAGERTAGVRFTYMDLVSRLFAENYTQQIGDWCRAHKVKYIGHLIEDNGAHARLGYGAGHFFRSIKGQDYPGLDLIHQVWPGVVDGRFSSQVGYLDADFYYWGITKMASSSAHITSEDSGTTVCEIFGAYGWQVGLKMMKWLTDHLCARGVNRLIPHAFSPKACDGDAPPHFYDRGLNPQWRYFNIWSTYANRVCHLLTGGNHVATAAVLYHAEAEWAGEYMPFEKPVKALAKQQIDCDVVPVDTFLELGNACIKDGCLQIGGERYRAMIVPYAEKLPEGMLESLCHMAKANIPVFFMNDYPAGSPLQTDAVAGLLAELRANPNVYVSTCDQLAEEIQKRDLHEVTVPTDETYLRCYHYQHNTYGTYFLVNEAKFEPVHTTMTLKATGVPVFYDAMENTYDYPAYTQNDGELTIQVDLDAFQSRFVFVFEDAAAADVFTASGVTADRKAMLGAFTPESTGGELLLKLDTQWKVSTSKAPEVTVFEEQPTITKLGSVAVPGLLPFFTGTIRYEADFELQDTKQKVCLDLGRVYEIAELWINDQLVGSKIAPPYCYEVSEFLKSGRNTIRVDVTNTLAKERGDNLLDRDMAQEPSGLIGPVQFWRMKDIP